eukprot:3868835-Heterocapsa_arctica.AAC.1
MTSVLSSTKGLSQNGDGGRKYLYIPTPPLAHWRLASSRPIDLEHPVDQDNISSFTYCVMAKSIRYTCMQFI